MSLGGNNSSISGIRDSKRGEDSKQGNYQQLTFP